MIEGLWHTRWATWCCGSCLLNQRASEPQHVEPRSCFSPHLFASCQAVRPTGAVSGGAPWLHARHPGGPSLWEQLVLCSPVRSQRSKAASQWEAHNFAPVWRAAMLDEDQRTAASQDGAALSCFERALPRNLAAVRSQLLYLLTVGGAPVHTEQRLHPRYCSGSFASALPWKRRSANLASAAAQFRVQPAPYPSNPVLPDGDAAAAAAATGAEATVQKVLLRESQ